MLTPKVRKEDAHASKLAAKKITVNASNKVCLARVTASASVVVIRNSCFSLGRVSPEQNASAKRVTV